MQYSQEHLKTMVYAEFGGQAECIMGNWKIENEQMWSMWICWMPEKRSTAVATTLPLAVWCRKTYGVVCPC